MTFRELRVILNNLSDYHLDQEAYSWDGDFKWCSISGLDFEREVNPLGDVFLFSGYVGTTPFHGKKFARQIFLRAAEKAHHQLAIGLKIDIEEGLLNPIENELFQIYGECVFGDDSY